jgi:hypothetical protein
MHRCIAALFAHFAVANPNKPYSSLMTEKRMCLVRHGETYANIQKVWHGSTDTQLTDNGNKQRRLLGEQQCSQGTHYYKRYLSDNNQCVSSNLFDGSPE